MSPFSRGHFRPGQIKSTGEKAPADSNPSKPMGKESPKPPQSNQSPMEHAPQHVTETHPGETQPHPSTGVHAFQAHHTGGGKFKSHTHHDGGDVESKDHNSHEEMSSSMHDALPPDESGEGHQGEMDMAGEDMAGIGGSMTSE